MNLRYINYLVVAFITSGLSLTCFTHLNKKHIEETKSELQKLYEENIKLEFIGIDSTLFEKEIETI